MQESELEMMKLAYCNLLNKYKKSNLVCFGRPDNFQFHQNELNQSIAEYLLQPFWKTLFELPEEAQWNERTEK